MAKRKRQKCRAGRNRVGGPREPNGQPLRTPERNDMNTSTVFDARCRRDGDNPKKADRKAVLDPLRGHALGRLFLAEIISESERDAGQKYEADYRAWAGTNGMPRITAPAGSYGQSIPGRDDIPDDKAAAATKAYFAARDALSGGAARGKWEVQWVCLQGEMPACPAALRGGLKRLVAHYG